MRHGIRLTLSGISALILALAHHESAAQNSADFTYNGFIAQGVQRAANSNFVHDEGDVSFALTEIGLNGRYQFSDTVSLNGQVVYLNNGNRYPEGVRIDYLFLDWHAVRNADWNVNVHLGRYKNYHWIYSATRDVPHTRPSNMLPQSIYFDSFRDIALGSDGVAVRANTSTSLGDWELNWSYGSSPVDRNWTEQLLGESAKGKINQDFVHQASVYWHSPDSDFTIGINGLDSDFDYEPGQQLDPFMNGDATVRRVSIAAQYQSRYWELTSEIMRERAIYRNVLFEDFVSDATGEGGYVQLTLMPSPRWDLLFRLDLYDQNRKDRSGASIPRLTGGQVPNYFGFMDTGTLGLTYQISEDMAIQAEFNRVRGAGRLTPLLVPDRASAPSEYWNMWSIQLMYWF
ncbi:TonB-dependent receptor [Alteromonas oceanisediminis]|uniref:TonB-dependent receptor n=1 Tax=Alteromonas oceanisediminis TaxID=2836180 RepID=UPI001BD9878E|nr:TonB-dependent receptor [Alteromonas oceanisediminis]MBT0586758.1 TonB-dependent receptor [Alteromonas oceanisediminis]